MIDFTAQDLADLRVMLNKANVDDGMISRGVRLTHQGMQKVADRFNIGVDQVPVMLTTLSSEKLSEDIDRYSYEADIMGNVTIRDADAGSEKFLRGNEAFQLLDQLKSHPEDGQKLIAACFGNVLMEFASASMADTSPEIVSNHGSLNFPYNGMLATAETGLDANGDFVLNVDSLRDNSENEVMITPKLRVELTKIAMKRVRQCKV